MVNGGRSVYLERLCSMRLGGQMYKRSGGGVYGGIGGVLGLLVRVLS